MEKIKIDVWDTVYKAGINEKTALVLLHGYGAHYEDLAPLSQVLNLPYLSWYFPNAPLEISLGMFGTGRAWFPIDERFFQLAQNPQGADLSQETPNGLEQRGKELQSYLKQIASKHDEIYLGGFSQGAMVALEAFLSLNPEDPFLAKLKGMIILSGSLLSNERWSKNLALHKKISFFQSHGENDPVLSYQQAIKLNELIKSYNYPIQFESHSGQHEIPPQVLSKLQVFLTP